MLKYLWPVVVLVGVAGFAIWLIGQRGPTTAVFEPGTEAAEVLPDLTRQDVGFYIEVPHLLHAYAESTKWYRSLDLTPVPDAADDDAFTRRWDHLLATSAHTSTDASLSDPQRQALAEAITLIFFGTSGGDVDDYLDRAPAVLGPLTGPNDAEEVSFVASEFLNVTPPDEGTSVAEWEAFFRKVYPIAQGFEPRRVKLVGVTSPAAFVAVERVPSRAAIATLGEPFLTDEQLDHFIGQLSGAATIFHGGRQILPVADAPLDATELRAQVSTIVETRDGDRFPYLLVFRLSPDGWRLAFASRNVTPRMDGQPARVF